MNRIRWWHFGLLGDVLVVLGFFVLLGGAKTLTGEWVPDALPCSLPSVVMVITSGALLLAGIPLLYVSTPPDC